MDKVLRVGKGSEGDIFVRVRLSLTNNLSITGVVGPMRNGDCRGSCGQIVMSDWGRLVYAAGWDADSVAKLRAVWGRWHLNDMQAGSPAQRAHLEARPVTGSDPYAAACESLRAAGINPDPGHLRDGKPYRYGSAWLREEVPADVIVWLESLPVADVTPAWV